MKTFLTATLGSVMTLAALISTGCHTNGVERAQDTRASMQTVETDIHQLGAQLDATSNSLNALLSPDQTDVKKAFDAYSESVNRMQNTAERFLKHSDAMASQGAGYFTEWSKEGESYTNPQIRAVSEERRAELSAAFTQISQSSVGVRGTLQTYLADLRDLRTFLSNDLTPRGLQAVKSTAEKTVQDGQSLKQSMQPVLAAVANARSRLAPGALPAPAGSSTGQVSAE